MGAPPLGGRRALHHRRAHERMAEADPAGLHGDETRVFGPLERALVRAQQLKRLNHRLDPARRAERRD